MRDLYELVRAIPPGRVASYGALGRALDRPISGLLVGRMMSHCPEDVPWWRVVLRDGRFAVDKRGPHIGQEQRALLRAESTPMVGDDQVAAMAFIDVDTLAV